MTNSLRKHIWSPSETPDWCPYLAWLKVLNLIPISRGGAGIPGKKKKKNSIVWPKRHAAKFKPTLGISLLPSLVGPHPRLNFRANLTKKKKKYSQKFPIQLFFTHVEKTARPTRTWKNKIDKIWIIRRWMTMPCSRPFSLFYSFFFYHLGSAFLLD